MSTKAIEVQNTDIKIQIDFFLIRIKGEPMETDCNEFHTSHIFKCAEWNKVTREWVLAIGSLARASICIVSVFSSLKITLEIENYMKSFK